jgi:hypothetical protein
MLLMSVLLASTIAQPIAHGPHCTASAVRSVVRDDDSAAPIILSVRNGSRYRLMGTDFIPIVIGKLARSCVFALPCATRRRLLRISIAKRTS